MTFLTLLTDAPVPLAAIGDGGAAAQIVQVVGAILILIAFAGTQAGRMDPHSAVYLALNLVGSLVLAGLAAAQVQYGFLLLEGVWAVVSLWGLIGALRGRPPRVGAH